MARLTRQPIFSCQRPQLDAEPLRRGALQSMVRGVAAPLGRIPLDSYLVEIAGIEPATSGLQSRRSPN